LQVKEIIQLMESMIKDPSEGLPEDIFLFVSTITPMINVDLLIKNSENHTLLTWRGNGCYAAGWHVPGGIVRYKERINDRIRAVAASELGVQISFNKEPLAISEIIHPSRKIRGHFMSLLYECTLTSPINQGMRYHTGVPKPGEWAWHSKCPDNLIAVHEMYRCFI